MAGTLTISTLSDGTNSTSATNAIQGSAKAWVNYKGTATVGIRASYNVSSVTYISAGRYTVNFTNAFADTNYSAVCSGTQASNTNMVAVVAVYATGSCTIWSGQPGVAGALDLDFINLSCFR